MAVVHHDPESSANTVLLVILIIAVVAFGMYFLLRTRNIPPAPVDEGVEFRLDINKEPSANK